MATRRSRGDGGLHWDKKRQRWIASVTVGYTPAGKRIVKRGSGKTKTEAKSKLREIIRDYEDGLAIGRAKHTVADAVTYFLNNGLSGRDADTVDNYRTMASTHIIPCLGARKLRELTVDEVDGWLQEKAGELSTRSLKLIHGILNRAMKNAMRRDHVKRNVVDLCTPPKGRAGRPSKSLTLEQAEAVLNAAEAAHPRMRAYIVVSLLSGARTEEVRALRWRQVVAYISDAKRWEPIANVGWAGHKVFALDVWRSVRESEDTKTHKSRRSLVLPRRCVEALGAHWSSARTVRADDFVFATRTGTAMSAHNARRDFRGVLATAPKGVGLIPKEWTPRELRHSFVSLLSDQGLAIEAISRLVGHSNTVVTETVYRQQLRPEMQDGAQAMDSIFPAREEEG